VGLKSVFDVVFLPKSFAFEETILSVWGGFYLAFFFKQTSQHSSVDLIM
jgi:hypothetical protein